MKKQYIAPETECYNILLTEMVAASVPMYGENATGEGMSNEEEDLFSVFGVEKFPF